MTLSRILKKAFIVSFIAFSSILLLCSIWVYTNRDTVIDKFVTEANKYLNTPVEVGKITLSIFETFPLIKIELEDVHITGNLPEEDSKPLLTAKRIEVLLDPFAVLDGNLSIKGVRLLNATCSMILQRDGTTNYQIFKKKDSAVKSKMDFELSSVLLKDINYYYQNDGSKLRMHTVAKSAKANLILEGGTYYIKSDGQYTISSIMVKQREYVSNKSLDGNISITYQTDLKSVKIEKSIVKIDGSRFLTDVTYSFQEKIPYINLSLEGEQTSIETIFNLLPARISKNFKRYKSRGSAFFSLRLEGQIRHKTGPQLAIDFGLENAEISYPNSALTIEGVSTKGLFLAEDILNLSTGTLEMTDIRGKFENKDFMSELVYKDFHNPHLTLAFDGAFELSSLSKLADISQIEDASGLMVL